ncbi:MAG: tRNA 2-thiouridine(34) synthase MnmA [Mycoplasmatales bacterium]
MAKVVVGLSGGVDSSVAAYLLLQEGHEVIGAFMQNWDPALNGDLADPYINSEICQAEEDFQDAKAVANKLGIPIHRIDFVKEYWDKVFQYFLNEYKIGRTPNPDIFCNKFIKFRAFLDYALENFECDYIAMGHYARVEHTPDVRMLRGIDTNKDQTYFLEQLNREQLSKSLFPVGHLTKPEVRKIASQQGLITANKKDSTGICFIGERNFTQFLTNYLHEKEGDFIDIKSGKFVQKHLGLMYYTIGQRKGLNIGGNKNFDGKPWFVVAKNVSKNIVYVAQGENNKWLLSDTVIVENVNYINKNKDIIKTVKFRYRSADVSINSYEWLDDNTIKIMYDPTQSVTPGQACVFYIDEECLGGGEIKSVSYKGDIRAYENSDTN